MEVIAGPAPAAPRTSHKLMQLPPIQTSFSNSSSQRVRPPNPIQSPVVEIPTKLGSVASIKPALTHRTSKGGLLAMFRRKMVTRSPGIHEELSTPVEGEQSTGRPMLRGTETSHTTTALACGQENVPTASRSRKLRRQSSKPGTRPRSLKRDLTAKTPTTWDPPPLFQAYPQAVKHANLRAPMISTKAILRFNGDRTITNTDQTMTQSLDNPDPANTENIPDKRNYSKRKSKHTLVEPIPRDAWTRNLYVLVTSGYFLQYSGEGTFDRLPEKIMALSKDSAAFASDAISGEHWVLQVSQFYDGNDLQGGKDQGSIMERIGFPRGPKRSVSSLLLVLDSAEELDSWLRAVRGEIESMGGKKYRPDSEVSGVKEDTAGKGREKLSHRYSMRSLDGYSRMRWDSTTDGGLRNVIRNNEAPSPLVQMSPTSTPRRRSIASQISGDSATVSNATALINQTCLDQLRGSPRLSYASTGVKSSSTSRGSSPGPSPRRVAPNPNIPLLEHASSLGEGATLMPKVLINRQASTQNSLHTRGNPSPASRSNSRSMSRSPRRLSTHRSPSRDDKSPPATNFSVPTFANCNSIVNIVSSTSTNQVPGFPNDDFDLSKAPPSQAAELHNEARDSVLSLPRSSSSYELSSLPPTNDRPRPRRLSSLQYSRGVQPRHLAAHDLLPPHPPPRSALPAVPSNLPPVNQRSLNGSSPQNRQLRRPLSMRVRNDPIRPVYHPLPQSISEDHSDLDHRLQPSLHFLSRPDRTPPLLPV